MNWASLKVSFPVVLNEPNIFENDLFTSLLEVTLLSAPVSSVLPFGETTLLRKQVISLILFGVSKNGKEDFVLDSPGNQKMYKLQCSR